MSYFEATSAVPRLQLPVMNCTTTETFPRVVSPKADVYLTEVMRQRGCKSSNVELDLHIDMS